MASFKGGLVVLVDEAADALGGGWVLVLTLAQELFESGA